MPNSYIYGKLKERFNLKSYKDFLDIYSIEEPITFEFDKLRHQTIYPNFKYALVPSKSKNYIVFVGKKELELNNLSDFFIEVYNNQIEFYDEDCLNMEFMMLDKIFKALNVNLDSNINEIQEYEELTFKQLHQYFEPIIIFEINNNLNFTSDIFHQVLINVLLENKNHIILDFTEDLLKEMASLNQVNNDNFYYKFLYKAVISATWEEVFLQFYRMIERVFPVFYFYKIYSKYEIKEKSLPIDIMAFSEHIEKFFGKRPDEQVVVSQIIEMYSECKDYEFFNLICNSKNSTNTLISSTDIAAAGTYFYAMRNSLIHAREIFVNSSEPKNIHVSKLIADEEVFKKLIKDTLKIVRHTYLKVGEYLHKRK